MATVREKMLAIADAIRLRIGRPDLLTLDDMANAITEVYGVGVEDGKISGIEIGKAETMTSWWNTVTIGGTRNAFEYMFQFWDFSYIGGLNCPYVLTPVYAGYMFRSAKGITKITKSQVDFSKIAALNLTFNGCADLEEIEEVYIPTSANSSFNNCSKLKKISRMVIKSDINTTTAFGKGFSGCKALADISIEGTIPNDVNFNDCPLTPKSMKSVINSLKDYSENNTLVYTVTFNNACWTALEADSAAPDGGTWKAYVNSKGWNV